MAEEIFLIESCLFCVRRVNCYSGSTEKKLALGIIVRLAWNGTSTYASTFGL